MNSNAFDDIRATDKLKEKTLEAAKAAAKQPRKKRIVVSSLSAIAAILAVTIGLTLLVPHLQGGKSTGGAGYGNLYEDARGDVAEPVSDPATVSGGAKDSSGETTTSGEAAEAPADYAGAVKDKADAGSASSGSAGTVSAGPAATGKPNPAPASVALTAAELRDANNFSTWLKDMPTDTFDNFGFLVTKQFLVHVHNDSLYLSGATVILLDQKQNPIRQAYTDKEGTACLYYNYYKGRQEAPAYIAVSYNGVQLTKPITKETVYDFSLTTGSLSSSDLDVMLVCDTTGSMSDELSYLQTTFCDLLKTFDNKTNLSLRTSVNFYRDTTDDYLVRSFPFTTSLSESRANLSAQSAEGGDDYEEAVEQALNDAVNKHEWREGSCKLLFLVLDAPPHQKDAAALLSAVESAMEKGIRVIPVAASGADQNTLYLLREIALLTNGSFVFLTDDSGIGASHEKPMTTLQYTVKPLDQILADIITRYTTSVKYTGES